MVTKIHTHIVKFTNSLLTCLLYRTAPEVFKNNQYTTKSDVWSFGVVMWEIFEYGAVPYGQLMNNKEVVEAVLSGTRLQQPFNCSDEVFAIMIECWKEVYFFIPSHVHVNNSSSFFRIVHSVLLLTLWFKNSHHSQQQTRKQSQQYMQQPMQKMLKNQQMTKNQ